MPRLLTLALALLALLTLCTESFAQNPLFDRIKAVQEVPIWRRANLNSREVQQALVDLKSSDTKTMQDAFEKLALARPIPQLTDLVVRETEKAKTESRDKFASAMTFEIKRDWEAAKDAAELLLQAKRAGGFPALERELVQSRPELVGKFLMAIAYSGNSRAAAVLADNWRRDRINGKQALLILGPPAAPLIARQLGVDDRLHQKEAVETLQKIGTKGEISELETAARSADPIMRRAIEKAIAEIESREKTAKS